VNVHFDYATGGFEQRKEILHTISDDLLLMLQPASGEGDPVAAMATSKKTAARNLVSPGWSSAMAQLAARKKTG